jgi:transposase
VETREDTLSNIGSYYEVKADKIRRHYKEKSSGFYCWNPLEHCEDYLVFNKNLGEYLSLDETSLSKGELYTYLTKKAGKGTLVACVKGTTSKDIVAILTQIPLSERLKVKEVTVDMAINMESAVIKSCPNAKVVTDRFHVVKLVLDAVQHLRVKLRWEAIDKENKHIEKCKTAGIRYKPKQYDNGDSPKQLLARSRYILAKKEKNWTQNQRERAAILYREYPQLEKAYKHCMQLRNIYENDSKVRAEELLNQWIEDTKSIGIEQFNTTAKSIIYNKENILNFFSNRTTNASAESFNSKVKLFRANLRGVTDVKFFLSRLSKLFA